MAIPELLEALLRARGPSGYEAEASRVWRDAAAAYGEVTTDVLGSSYVRVPGGDAPTLAVLGANSAARRHSVVSPSARYQLDALRAPRLL